MVTDGLIRHVFGADGNSRLYHVAIGPGGVITRENVTAQLTPDRVSGYSDYQLPYAGRVYSDVSAVIDPVTKDLYVYGTNGRDLIQFHQPVGGQWDVAESDQQRRGRDHDRARQSGLRRPGGLRPC